MSHAPYTFRRAQPEDIPSVIALADRVFRPDGASSMRTEFPLFLSPHNAHNIHIAAHADEIVSMLGVFPRTLVLPHTTLPVAMIGAVATDERHRGHGLAGALLDAALAAAHANGIAIIFISGDRGLYMRRGARYAGALSRCTVPPETWQSWRPASGVVWRPHETADGPALFELHLHQSPRFARTASDMDVMIRARTCGAQTFTACRNGSPAAYAMFKSIRETATISEFNGDPACLHGITACLPPGFTGALEFLLPTQHPLLSHLQHEPHASHATAPFDGTIIWANFPACIAALAPHWRARGIPELHGELCGGHLVLTDGRTPLALSAPDMCAAVWGAPDAPALPPAWRPALPLPLCPYGLDYI